MNSEVSIALAGNPNVGKSTVFNALTGLHQHTGNWPGKTVSCASGCFTINETSCHLIDLPGTYSLIAHSAEEEVARNVICFEHPDLILIVCDATCLERNLNLVLQTLEITSRVIVCVNMMDEAAKKQIHIDLKGLSDILGCPVVGTAARNKKNLSCLLHTLETSLSRKEPSDVFQITYCPEIEDAILLLEPVVACKTALLPTRFLCLKLLEQDESMLQELTAFLGEDFFTDPVLTEALEAANSSLLTSGISRETRQDKLTESIVRTAEQISGSVLSYGRKNYDRADRKLDRILTGRFLAYPVMFLLLAFVFWLTIAGANYPSTLLSSAFTRLETLFTQVLVRLNAPEFINLYVVQGMYRVLSWVVAVMLPPMAIFFPLFTFLEDVGYLPRIAFNLDKPFQKCHACGKQALTLCMGFGCNAAGVTGCRIIDSKRERLIAILTNSLVPCNGRFPTLIVLITLFFSVTGHQAGNTIFSAVLLSGIIILGIGMTFFLSWILSKTVLKGLPSSFTLELPPYRKPQLGRILIRSVLDRTLFVLGRAAAVAAPAGLLLTLLANIYIRDDSLLHYFAGFLEPFGRLLGMDGVILAAFILAFPANEIVIPIIMMTYMAQGSLSDYESLGSLKQVLLQNGWTPATAACTTLFTLFHWPCSTTLITIKKETGSMKWTVLAALLPTITGMLLCFLIASLARLAGV